MLSGFTSNPPDKALVLSVDEKSRVQSLPLARTGALDAPNPCCQWALAMSRVSPTTCMGMTGSITTPVSVTLTRPPLPCPTRFPALDRGARPRCAVATKTRSIAVRAGQFLPATMSAIWSRRNFATFASIKMVNAAPFSGSLHRNPQGIIPPDIRSPPASQPRSLDHRLRVRAPLTAIASAFRCPTRITRRLPRVTPV